MCRWSGSKRPDGHRPQARSQPKRAGGRCQLKSADVASLRMLRRARDRIDRDYAEEIDIPALAAGAGYSREHFIRAFRTTYGETPGRYRTRRRVERACELLRSANLTVTEICHLVGFTSLGTFSARFAELTGLSPTAYRKQAAERGGPAPIPGCYALMWRAGLPEPGSGERITSREAPAPGRAVQSRHEPQAHQPGQRPSH
jgi:AraC-like DNA-binding protein